MNEDYVIAAIACARAHGYDAAEVKQVWEDALKRNPDMSAEELFDITEECASLIDYEGEDADHDIKCAKN